MVKRLFVCLFVCLFPMLALLAGATPAAADDTAAAPERRNLHWRCWYDQQVHIRCLLDSAPSPTASTGSAPARLPKIVQDLRNRPSTFKSVLIRIPMHTAPYDAHFPQLLAEATMCGGRKDCSVKYSHEVPHHEEIASILLRDLNLPAPAMQLASAD